MTAYVIPAGFPLGPRYDRADPPARQPRTYEVHLADDIVDLGEEEYLTYVFASRDRDRHAVNGYTRSHLVQDVRRDLPGAEAESLVDKLLQRGVLLEVDPDGDLEPVFRRHRLFPTGQGLGGTPEDPHLHTIAVGGEPVMRLSEVPATMWAFSFLYASLWEACADLAAGDAELIEGGGPAGLSAAGVARDVARGVSVMIATRSAFLDPLLGSS